MFSGDETTIETARIGDIAICSNAEIGLQIDISAHAGIERIEVKDGLQVLEHIQMAAEDRKGGNRVRIQCEGAEYRGRSRRVEWDVALSLHDVKLLRTQAVNFWNADCTVACDASSARWDYVTTGGTHAVDIWLDEATKGTIRFDSNVTRFDIDLAKLGTADLLHECGGLNKAVRVTRLPEETLPETCKTTIRLPLEPGVERCLFVRVTFEDSHIAWTSPIYLKSVKDGL